MSSFTDVETGRLSLLFLAWQVRMESRSDLSSLSSVNTFSTLNSEGRTELSSTIWWSLHQLTSGLGLPPTTRHFSITESPSL